MSIKERLMKVRELISSHEHNSWAGWMKYIFSRSFENSDGSVLLYPEDVKRWKRQIDTDYLQLSDGEKRSDRNEVDAFMNEFIWHLKEQGLEMKIVEIE